MSTASTTATPLATELADAATELGGLAIRFAAINRTCCYWPDQETPESDTDHTVMLAWIAPPLAARLYPQLDTGLVTEFAVLHDAVEVFCGDTPTLRITAAGRAAKAAREHAAAAEWHRRFAGRFPWLADRLERYERQEEPEARFVRATDKFLPRIIHAGDRCKGLHEIGMTTTELAASMRDTATSVAAYAAEFPALLAVGEELAARTLAIHAEGVAASELGTCPASGPGSPAVRITSFGYRHPLPSPPADIVINLQDHLRDPHVDPALRDLTGQDPEVVAAVLATPGAPEVAAGLALIVRGCHATGAPVTVAIGCAGGRHRSVVIANHLAGLLTGDGIPAEVTHRDISQPVLSGRGQAR